MERDNNGRHSRLANDGLQAEGPQSVGVFGVELAASTGRKISEGSNRRMRETRTSGGVGGCRGAIPGTRPDLRFAQAAAQTPCSGAILE